MTRKEQLKAWVREHPDPRFRKAYHGLNRNFSLTLTHYASPSVLRDNNMIEAFNAIISTKVVAQARLARLPIPYDESSEEPGGPKQLAARAVVGNPSVSLQLDEVAPHAPAAVIYRSQKAVNWKPAPIFRQSPFVSCVLPQFVLRLIDEALDKKP